MSIFLIGLVEIFSGVAGGVFTALILAISGFLWKMNGRFSSQDTALAVILVKLDQVNLRFEDLRKEVDEIKTDLKGK